MQSMSRSPLPWVERSLLSPCDFTKRERKARRVLYSLHRSLTSRCSSWPWSRPNYEQYVSIDGASGRAQREGVEGHVDSRPDNHGGAVTLAAANGSKCAPAARDFLIRQGAKFPAPESKRRDIRIRTVEWKNLDRGFHFHLLSRTMPDNQHTDERVAEAARENRCASCLVYGRPGQRYAGSLAQVRGGIAGATWSLGFSHRTAIRYLRSLAQRLQTRRFKWQR